MPFPTESCLAYYAEFRVRGWVGISVAMDTLSGETRIVEVFPDAPGVAAGFKPGDIVLAVDGSRFGDPKSLNQAKGGWRIGGTNRYEIRRDGKDIAIDVVRAAVPEPLLAQWTGRHMLDGHLAAGDPSIR